MRRMFASWSIAGLMGGLLVVAVGAEPQSASKSLQTAAARAVKPTATIQDIMRGVIDPASKSVFTAVSTEVVGGVERKQEPHSDAEWASVRNSALQLVEGADLIMMSGRHVAADLNAKPAEGELSAAEIEKALGRNRTAWNKFATEFHEAAMVSVRAAETKDPDAIFASGEGIDTACENCHLAFWYPDQDKLFEKPAK